MRKIGIGFLLFILLLPVSVNASEVDTPSEVNELGSSVKIEGELSPVVENSSGNLISPQCIACVGGIAPTYKVKTLSGPVKVKKFVRYLTGSWAKSNGYTWKSATSASSTLSADLGLSASSVSGKLGVSNTVKTTYSTSIRIPANSKKFSKLAFYSDYNRRHVRVEKRSKGKLVSSKTGYHYAPRKDTYLQVVYK